MLLSLRSFILLIPTSYNLKVPQPYCSVTPLPTLYTCAHTHIQLRRKTFNNLMVTWRYNFSGRLKIPNHQECDSGWVSWLTTNEKDKIWPQHLNLQVYIEYHVLFSIFVTYSDSWRIFLRCKFYLPYFLLHLILFWLLGEAAVTCSVCGSTEWKSYTQSLLVKQTANLFIHHLQFTISSLLPC